MNVDQRMIEAVTRAHGDIRQLRPLIHCMTNRVTINDCANAVLAVGASPIMAEDIREVNEIIGLAGALVVNLGIISETIFEAMLTAGRAAKEGGVPVVLDPVGCGASRLRTNSALQFARMVKPDIIRGNLSEIQALGGFGGGARGVDAAGDDVDDEAAIAVVSETARHFGATIAATGATDIVSDGTRAHLVKNGHPMLQDITGSGCMLTALIGACAAASDPYTGTVTAITLMGIAGETAHEAVTAEGRGIGTFHMRLFDALYLLTPEKIRERGKIYAID